MSKVKLPAKDIPKEDAANVPSKIEGEFIKPAPTTPQPDAGTGQAPGTAARTATQLQAQATETEAVQKDPPASTGASSSGSGAASSSGASVSGSASMAEAGDGAERGSELHPQSLGATASESVGKPSASIMSIVQPEEAISVLKEKVNTLHTLVHNVGNFKTLAVGDIEGLLADVKFLVTFVRSKV